MKSKPANKRTKKKKTASKPTIQKDHASSASKSSDKLRDVEEQTLKPLEDDVVPSTQRFVVGVYITLIILGIGTGYILANKSPIATTQEVPQKIESETVVGIADESTFKDSAEGTLEKGGLDGEGTHKLIREGGPSQTAYLMSSVVDLDQFVGKEVKIWGQTMAAEKASWLMDVGKVELLSQ